MTEPTQRELQTLVDREVIYCASHLIHELGKVITSLCVDDCVALECLQGGYAQCPDCFDGSCGDCNEGEVLIEVFEHWIISDWLAKRLEQLGEIVCYDFMGLTIWGRQCSGQSIMLDNVITEVWKDLQRVCEAA